MRQDQISLNYDEASFLLFVLESYVEDHADDLKISVGTRARQAFAEQVRRRLYKFIDISKRCGITGPPDSKGDWPCCALLPHSVHKAHAYTDLHTGAVVHWKGNKGSDYLTSLAQKFRKNDCADAGYFERRRAAQTSAKSKRKAS